MKMRGAGLPHYDLSVMAAPRPLTIIQNGSGWFGAGLPMAPSAPANVSGRTWDYQASYNLAVKPRAYEPLSFADLRGFADGCDMLRLVIETRKDQVGRMKWKIQPKDAKTRDPKLLARADELNKFWRRPDGKTRFHAWLRKLLEDLFVIDAPTIYKQRNRKGDLIRLKVLDGATIKRVIDYYGDTPEPEDPTASEWPTAYQQILHGLPAVNYSARDIIYAPRNLRVHKAYGFSPTEQVVVTVNIALRRQLSQVAYYTSGNVPDSLIGTPDNWNVDQIRAFQDYWDNTFEGDAGKRRTAKFVPGGIAKTFIQTREPELTGAMEEWLARFICYAFSISPQWAVRMMNRATGETAKEAADEEGLHPIMEWGKNLIDDVLEMEQDAADFEFVWLLDEELDAKAQSEIDDRNLKNGSKKINEVRVARGDDPYPEPAADVPMVLTGAGYVPLNNYELTAAAAKEAAQSAQNAAPDGRQAGDAGDGAAGADTGAGPVSTQKPTEKLAKRGLVTVPFARPATRKAIKGITAIMVAALKDQASDVADQVTAALTTEKLAKSADDEFLKMAADIVATLNLDTAASVVDDLAAALSEVADDSIAKSIAQIGVEDASELMDAINARAVKWAEGRAAELVGMKRLNSGKLVTNPDAEKAITSTTREVLRKVISDGLADNIGTPAIAKGIREAAAFGKDRALLIAEHEVAEANSESALMSYRSARDAGVKVKKTWHLGPNPCKICKDNADDGAIDLDASFSSGHIRTPAHNRCECVMVPEVED